MIEKVNSPIRKQMMNEVEDFSDNSFICDYYVCFNKKSEFIYMAINKISAYSLSKKFLQEDIFPKYPHIANKIKQGADLRYMLNVRRVLME